MSERTQLQPVAGLGREVRLPPPPRKTQPVSTSMTDSQESERPQSATQPAEATAERPRRGPGRPRRVRSAADAGGLQSMTLSLPAAVVEALKLRARADGITQVEVLLDALSVSQDDLRDLVARSQEKPVSDGVFLRRSTRKPAEPKATLSLGVLAANIEAIDRISIEVGASSRSALCAVALRSYLGVPPLG